LKRKLSCSANDCLKRQLSFNACQRSAKTKVTGPAKRQVAIVRPANVKPIGIWKPFRVAVAGGHDSDNGLIYVFGGSSAGVNQNGLFAYDPVAKTWAAKATGPADEVARYRELAHLEPSFSKDCIY